MPNPPRKSPRRRSDAARAATATLLVALQTLIAFTLLTLLVGAAEGAPAPSGSAEPVAQASARRALPAPRPLSPAPKAKVKAVPTFSWAPVRRAAKYEFQLAADRAFKSIVLRQGKGSFQTYNTFATIDKTLADGNYYWRARAIDKRDRAGRWTRTRSIVKAWSNTPVILQPADGGTVTYPRQPLTLRWKPGPLRIQVPGRDRDRQVARPLGARRAQAERRDLRLLLRAAGSAVSGPLLLGRHATRQ